MIGLCSISNILVAKIFGKTNGGPGLGLTLGGTTEGYPYRDAVICAESMGNEVVFPGFDGLAHDHRNHIVTAPAYLYDGTPCETFESVRKMVEATCHYVMRRRILVNPIL